MLNDKYSRDLANASRANADLFLLSALVFFAIVIRIPGLFTDRLWPDEALYAYQAREIVRHPAFLLSPEAWQHHFPIFSAFLSLGWLLNPSVVGLRLLILILGVSAIPLVYGLGRRWFSSEVGLLAAGLLASNRIFFCFSHFILIDIALALSVLAMFFLLERIDRKGAALRHHFSVGVAMLLAVLFKWYAILFVLPQVGLFYLFFLKQPLRERLRGFIVALLPVGIIGVPFAALKIWQVAREGGPAVFHPLPWYSYLQFAPMLLGGGFLTVLFFVGCFYLIRGGYRAKGPIFLWILVPLVVFSCVAEKDGRYLLPVLPAVALVSAMAIVGLRDAFFKTATVRRVIFLMAIFLIFMLGMWTTKDMYSHHLYRHYSGFQEAGDLVRQRARPGDLVLAGSVRAMRFTTDITLKEYGGSLASLPMDLEQLRTLSFQGQRVILEVDAWEYIQPEWAYPLTEEKGKVLLSMGFQLVKVIYRDVGYGKEPVVWLMEKN